MNKFAERAEKDFVKVINVMRDARKEMLEKEYKTLSDTLSRHFDLHTRFLETKTKGEIDGITYRVQYEITESTKQFYRAALKLLETELDELNKLEDLFLDLKEARIYREWTLSYERVLHIYDRIKYRNERSFTKESIDIKGRQTFKESDTKIDIKDVLRKLNKPFIKNVWDTTMEEHESRKVNIYGLYLKNISYPQYRDLAWKDSIFE